MAEHQHVGLADRQAAELERDQAMADGVIVGSKAFVTKTADLVRDRMERMLPAGTISSRLRPLMPRTSTSA